MTESAPLAAQVRSLGEADPIESIDIALVRIPLRNPVKIAIAEIPFREYNLVTVTTRDGITGTGYARGGTIVDLALREYIAPHLVGRDSEDLDGIWDLLYQLTIQVGRRGAVLRAISAVDIALWDVRARRARQPLWRLLGGTRDRVPCYASGGYYGTGRDLVDLEREIEGYAIAGFSAVKIKVGGADLDTDARRVALVRATIGADSTVMVDANTGYDTDKGSALALAHSLREHGVRFFEEPFGPDRIKELSWLRAQGVVPIASGEQESTRWAFETLLDAGAVDVVQPDVTVVGGVSEWLRVARKAEELGLPLAPHYFPEVHAQLAGAVPHTEWVEYFTRGIDIVNFDDVMAEPLAPVDGFITLSKQPGVGLDLDPEAVRHFRVR